MSNGTPVIVDVLDAKSALDSDANFTGVKKRISKVTVFDFMAFQFADERYSYYRRSVLRKPVQSIVLG
jgi:hypothetical protein